MVRFRSIKASAWLDLRHDRRVESPRLVELGYEGLRDVALLGIHRKDRGPVLRADVGSLTVQLRRIVDHREKHLQDSPVGDDARIESDLHGLGVTGASCAHALILGRALFSTGVTRDRARHALQMLIDGLNTPETSSGENRNLG